MLRELPKVDTGWRDDVENMLLRNGRQFEEIEVGYTTGFVDGAHVRTASDRVKKINLYAWCVADRLGSSAYSSSRSNGSMASHLQLAAV